MIIISLLTSTAHIIYYTAEECELLAKCLIHISIDFVIGNNQRNQRSKQLWKRIAKRTTKVVPPTLQNGIQPIKGVS